MTIRQIRALSLFVHVKRRNAEQAFECWRRTGAVEAYEEYERNVASWKAARQRLKEIAG